MVKCLQEYPTYCQKLLPGYNQLLISTDRRKLYCRYLVLCSVVVLLLRFRWGLCSVAGIVWSPGLCMLWGRSRRRRIRCRRIIVLGDSRLSLITWPESKIIMWMYRKVVRIWEECKKVKYHHKDKCEWKVRYSLKERRNKRRHWTSV